MNRQPYRCRLAWGRRGAHQAAERGDILAVVDVLSFSTAVIAAAHRGALIYPCSEEEDKAAAARRIGGEAAVSRKDAPAKGRFSLSPLSYLQAEPGAKIVLSSPNGAACSRHAAEVPYLFIGAIVNAQAAALKIADTMKWSGLGLTVLACGERWKQPNEEGSLRFALEDYLGAGAILSCLDAEKSPDALVCEAAFRGVCENLDPLLRHCESGQELIEMGYEDDVAFSACLNRYDSVPVMRDGWLVRGQ